jgi:glycosyltransferase involved in cell wall biosynthesis
MMRIGLDVAQTCVERYGPGWVADQIARALVVSYPEDRFYLYHQFGLWRNRSTRRGTRIESPNAVSPFLHHTWLGGREDWTETLRRQQSLPGDPDIVHAHSIQAPEVGSSRLVVTIYDLGFWAYPELSTERNRLYCQAGALEALHRADGIVFISEHTREAFYDYFPALGGRFGHRTAVLRPASRFPIVNAPRQFVSRGGWLAVGSAEGRKNLEILLRAQKIYWKRSSQQRPLLIAGVRKNSNVWPQIQELESASMARSLGYVPDSELRLLYGAAFALLFPSRHEGFGLPVIEAMSQACPVICSRHSGLTETAGQAALFWDQVSADTLAETMLNLENDETAYLGLSRLGLEQAQAFSWQDSARRIHSFYAEICGDVEKKEEPGATLSIRQQGRPCPAN